MEQNLPETGLSAQPVGRTVLDQVIITALTTDDGSTGSAALLRGSGHFVLERLIYPDNANTRTEN